MSEEKKTFSDKAMEIVDKINGWKTIIGAVGTPIASVILALTPSYTLAHQISFGFTVFFGTVGIAGVVHKSVKSELPKGLRK